VGNAPQTPAGKSDERAGLRLGGQDRPFRCLGRTPVTMTLGVKRFCDPGAGKSSGMGYSGPQILGRRVGQVIPPFFVEGVVNRGRHMAATI